MKYLILLLTAYYCLASSSVSLAAEKKWFESDQPVSLKSKHILVNQKNGDITYRGNVRIKQGGLLITASQARTTSAGNQPDQVWASGNPVRIQHKRGSDLVTLTASSVHYNVKSGVITLTGNVQLQIGNDTLESKKLFYNVETNTITVNTKDTPLTASFDPEHIKELRK